MLLVFLLYEKSLMADNMMPIMGIVLIEKFSWMWISDGVNLLKSESMAVSEKNAEVNK